MEPKRTKYDTNPLDDKVADRAEETWTQTESLRSEATREFDNTARNRPETEAPTRRMNDKFVSAYQSVFVPPSQQTQPIYQPPPASANIYQPPPVPPANVYQAPPKFFTEKPGARHVAGLNISERWATLLPYIPGHIGAIAAVIELLLVPRTESRTRFHAAQGLALQIAIVALTIAFQFVTLLTGSRLGSGLFGAASTIFLIVSMARVWKGKTHHIAPLDDATKWLDAKIKPRK